MSAPTLRQMARVFGRIGLLSFGGPAAQIALMHKELVEVRPWLSEEKFLGALSFCMLLPGPEAMQLATYAGWRLRGVPGGLIGGLLFVLPGAALIAALALAYAAAGDLPLVRALFLGVKATVVVVVLQALSKLGRRALKGREGWLLAGASFLAIFALNLPFPMIVAAAGLFGALRSSGTATPAEAPAAPAATGRTIAIWAGLWAAPVALLWAAQAQFLLDVALFFSRLAIVTFGGAYAVLAFMTQEVVTGYGWIDTAQMLDALGLAETTPGPLILVTQFVAMMAGAGLGGAGLMLAAGAVALWVTFVPCFLWIFAGAPYVERITRQPRLAGALRAITAAVVGVILNLSVWFAAHVFFARVGRVETGPLAVISPDPLSFQFSATLLAGSAACLLIGLRLPLPLVLAVNAGAGAGLAALLPG